ncbi:DUF4349 domain-containing protein [Streptomyces sp. NPDC008150]|uniref:DUF4349 domain-containing protein n=1 Tax=Streptomyces sp. NPDC008150 TaxID=3364816 RepID=UPI0036E89666
MRARRTVRGTTVTARLAARPVHVVAGLLLASSLALAGCGAGGGGDSDSGAQAAGDKAAPRQAAPGGADDKAGTGVGSDSGAGSGSSGKSAAQVDVTPNAVIRTATLSVRVKDVPKALDEARAAAENAGGYVGDETTSRDTEGHERTRVVLRVPAERYEDVLGTLQGTGRLIDRTSKATDVTDQVVDVRSRIASQRASVARVRELMDRAVKLSDVVELEGQLSSRQADLESLLARQASLKDRTSLATITLSLSETPTKAIAAKHDDPGFMDALAGGWNVFVTLLRWLLLALGAVLPFAAVGAVVVAAWVGVARARGAARPAADAGAPGTPGTRDGDHE